MLTLITRMRHQHTLVPGCRASAGRIVLGQLLATAAAAVAVAAIAVVVVFSRSSYDDSMRHGLLVSLAHGIAERVDKDPSITPHAAGDQIVRAERGAYVGLLSNGDVFVNDTRDDWAVAHSTRASLIWISRPGKGRVQEALVIWADGNFKTVAANLDSALFTAGWAQPDSPPRALTIMPETR